MLQRGHHAADFCHPCRIDIGIDDAGFFAGVRQHLAPGIDDQCMPVGLAVTGMLTAHRRRQHISGIFNRTRLEKGVPVGFPGLALEG